MYIYCIYIITLCTTPADQRTMKDFESGIYILNVLRPDRRHNGWFGNVHVYARVCACVWYTHVRVLRVHIIYTHTAILTNHMYFTRILYMVLHVNVSVQRSSRYCLCIPSPLYIL